MGRLSFRAGFLGEEWLQVWLTRPKHWLTGVGTAVGQRKRKKQGGVNAERRGGWPDRGLSSYTPWGPIKYQVTAFFFFLSSISLIFFKLIIAGCNLGNTERLKG